MAKYKRTKHDLDPKRAYKLGLLPKPKKDKGVRSPSDHMTRKQLLSIQENNYYAEYSQQEYVAEEIDYRLWQLENKVADEQLLKEFNLQKKYTEQDEQLALDTCSKMFYDEGLQFPSELSLNGKNIRNAIATLDHNVYISIVEKIISEIKEIQNEIINQNEITKQNYEKDTDIQEKLILELSQEFDNPFEKLWKEFQ